MKKSILIFSLLLGCAQLHSNAQIKQSTIDDFTISKNAKNLLSTQNEKVNEDELFVVQKIKLNIYALPKVTLKDVKASCGCTATNYTKTAIKPGEKGTVTATYNAASGGAFHKTVTVTTSEENTIPKTITIKGTVKVNEAPAVAAPASK